MAGLTARQVENAALIYDQGVDVGVPEQGLVVALATAMQESSLWLYANDGSSTRLDEQESALVRESLAYPHDRVGNNADSLNLFQQRPFQHTRAWGWGTVPQLMDRVYCANAFYDALLKVPGWFTMPVGVAAQTVQRSAHPNEYAKHEPLARQLVEAFK